MVLESGTPAPAERTVGEADLVLVPGARGSRIQRLYQKGAAKIRFPRVEPGGPLEAVILNTAGGLTGGDRFSVRVALRPGTRAVVTSQACERLYRSTGAFATIDSRLGVSADATLEWLPQETILFDRSRLKRSVTVDLATGSRFLLAESVLFGRTAMGETVIAGHYRDDWTVRLDGRLLHSERTRLDGAVEAALMRPAVAGGGRAVATVLSFGPDLEQAVDRARAAIAASRAEGGASLVNGLLIARLVAADGRTLRESLIPCLRALRHGAPLPRVWAC